MRVRELILLAYQLAPFQLAGTRGLARESTLVKKPNHRGSAQATT
jgi:hypothetical protein